MTRKVFFGYVVVLFFVVLGLFLFRIVYTNSQELVIPATSILINEIKPSGGTAKTTEEYIELYNPLSVAVDISGWVVARQTKSASSTEYNILATLPPNLLVQPGHYVLISHQDYKGEVEGDVVYVGGSITDDNTIILMDSTGQVADLVGYGKAENLKTLAAPAPSGQLLSIERLKDENGNVRDTGNNALDFVRASPSPQNLSFFAPSVTTTTTTIDSLLASTSTVEVEEISTSTAGFVDDDEDTVTPVSPSPPVVGSILITELLPIPGGGEEFVELYNRTSADVSLFGWWLEDGGGFKTALNGTIAARHYVIIEKPKGNLNNSGDSVHLFGFDGTVVDRVVYGDWGGEDAKNAPGTRSGFSLVRLSLEYDSDNHYQDFVLTRIVTPGAKNQFEIAEAEDEADAEENTQTNSATATVTTEPGEAPKVKAVKENKSEKKSVPRLKISADKKIDFNEPAIFDASETVNAEEPVYVWDMGDGTVLEGEVVDHWYQQPGYYVVTLTMTDLNFRRVKKVKIEVESPPEKKKTETTVAKKGGEKKAPEIQTQKIDKPVFVPINALPGLKSTTMVTITGVVAAEPDSYNKKKEFYVVDEVSGNGVRVVYKKERPAIVAGDRITLTGKYTAKYDESYVTLERTDFLVILQHESVPTPQVEKVSTAGSLAGGLIKVSGEITEAKKDYAFVDDNTGEIKINGLKKQKISLRDHVDVTGVLVKTREGLELHPRTAEDVVIKQIGAVTTTQLREKNGIALFAWQWYVAGGMALFLILLILIKKILFSGRANDVDVATIE